MGLQELAVVGLAGSGIGTVVGLPMAWPRGRHQSDVRLLGVALVLLSAIAGIISARAAGLVPTPGAAEHAVNLLGLAALPLIVLYTRETTNATPLFRGLPVLWLPAAAYLAYVVPRVAMGLDADVPFAWMLPVVIGFTLASGIHLWRRPAARPAVLVPPGWIVGYLAAVNVAQVVRMMFGHVEPVRAIVPLVMSSGFVAMVGFLAWRSASAAGDLTPVAPWTVGEPGPAPAVGGGAVPRYQKSGLDQAVAPGLVDRIHCALAADRLFARVDLTLADLSRAAGSTPHQVSEALNRYAGVSFHELLSRRRVDDVKAQLLDPANDVYTIEGIGLSAGFGSRSALYAAFRRHEGMTPAAFKSQSRPRIRT
jgi:AraC-like DNA-binding protein